MPVGQPKSGEQRLLQAFAGRQHPALRHGVAAIRHTLDVLLGARHVLPADDPLRVECAPQPNPSHSPSVQYLRLWRDSRPGRATFEISYCSSPARFQPLHRAQSTSPPRRRPAPATSPRAPCPLSAARSDRARAGRATRGRARPRSARRRSPARPRTLCPGSHIIRSRLTLSNPAARASRTAARARSAE